MKKNRGHSTNEVLLKIILIIIGILAGIGLFSILVWCVDKAMQGPEKYECNLWSENAKNYPEHFAQWQVDQCARYNIDLK